MITQEEFRNAMARLGAAVNIITSDGEAGRCGLTVSAMCSVSGSITHAQEQLLQLDLHAGEPPPWFSGTP